MLVTGIEPVCQVLWGPRFLQRAKRAFVETHPNHHHNEAYYDSYDKGDHICLSPLLGCPIFYWQRIFRQVLTLFEKGLCDESTEWQVCSLRKFGTYTLLIGELSTCWHTLWLSAQCMCFCLWLNDHTGSAISAYKRQCTTFSVYLLLYGCSKCRTRTLGKLWWLFPFGVCLW